MSRLDEISPLFIGEDRIKLSIDPALTILSDRAVTVDLDYTDAGGIGAVVPPIILTAQPAFGDGTGYVEKIFRGNPPTTFTFRPRGAGEWLIVAKESAHNLWQGRLIIQVEGEEFDAEESL